MKAFFDYLSAQAVIAIQAVALLVIVFGTIEITIAASGALIRQLPAQESRNIWLRYARWLVAGLTFQLAADILETAISSDWQTIARVGAIAAIRTFLNYFLERDLDDVRTREREAAAAREPPAAEARASPRGNGPRATRVRH